MAAKMAGRRLVVGIALALVTAVSAGARAGQFEQCSVGGKYPVRSVTAYVTHEDAGYTTYDQFQGAEVFVPAQPGLTSEWLQRVLADRGRDRRVRLRRPQRAGVGVVRGRRLLGANQRPQREGRGRDPETRRAAAEVTRCRSAEPPSVMGPQRERITRPVHPAAGQGDRAAVGPAGEEAGRAGQDRAQGRRAHRSQGRGRAGGRRALRHHRGHASAGDGRASRWRW